MNETGLFRFSTTASELRLRLRRGGGQNLREIAITLYDGQLKLTVSKNCPAMGASLTKVARMFRECTIFNSIKTFNHSINVYRRTLNCQTDAMSHGGKGEVASGCTE